MNFLAMIGRVTIRFFRAAGRLGIFAGTTLKHFVLPPFYFREFFRQLIEIGFYSLPVVGLTTLFSGMVLTLQSYAGFQSFAQEGTIAKIVAIALTRELGPVLAGLMVAGRIGASMAAEIGTMRVTEQIDALSSLSTNPFKYLIAPRILAGVLMVPVLVFIGDIIGIYGGYIVSIYKLDFNAANYIRFTWESLQAMDFICSLTKAAVFGFVITLMGCYNGYHSKGGAQGVGAATTNAVVSACIMILFSNYILTEIFFMK